MVRSNEMSTTNDVEARAYSLALRKLATVADVLSVAAKRLSIKLIYHRVGDMESTRNCNVRREKKKKIANQSNAR